MQSLRLRRCKKQQSEDKFSLLSVAFFFFFFHGIFSAVRTPSLPPAPTGASGEGVFQGELPSQRGESAVRSPGEAAPGKSAALCLRSSRCPMTGKNGKKSNPRRWETWGRAQHTNHSQQTGRDELWDGKLLSWSSSMDRAPQSLSQLTPNTANTQPQSWD